MGGARREEGYLRAASERKASSVRGGTASVSRRRVGAHDSGRGLGRGLACTRGSLGTRGSSDRLRGRDLVRWRRSLRARGSSGRRRGRGLISWRLSLRARGSSGRLWEGRSLVSTSRSLRAQGSVGRIGRRGLVSWRRSQLSFAQLRHLGTRSSR